MREFDQINSEVLSSLTFLAKYCGPILETDHNYDNVSIGRCTPNFK